MCRHPTVKGKLRTQCNANLELGRPPYAGVKIRTLGELLWVLNEHNWSGDRNEVGKQRPDLREVDLYGVHLKHTRLFRAQFTGVDLAHANLEQADLRAANPMGARLWYTNLAGANLSEVVMDEST